MLVVSVATAQKEIGVRLANAVVGAGHHDPVVARAGKRGKEAARPAGVDHYSDLGAVGVGLDLV